MKRAVVVLAVVLFSAAVLAAQEPEVVFRPGDTVRIVVTFKSPVNLDSGACFFRFRGELQENQRGFGTEFGLHQLARISDTEYEFSGTVPPTSASGRWRLEIIDPSSEGVARRYQFGQGFNKEVVIRIVNPKHVQFPDIEDVTVKPPR